MHAIYVALCFASSGCRQSREGPGGATGDTSIRYVVCATGERDCRIAARFASLDACEHHKQIEAMLCDRKSEPGEISCHVDSSSAVSSGYCLP